MEIHLELNGRRVNPNDIGDAFSVAAFKAVSERIKAKVGHIVCPAHGQHAKILAKGRSISELNLEVSGCCDELIQKVKDSLK